MTLQQKMLAKQSKKGFTLVELVVVIAILAILAAIAIPAVVGIINNANESQAKSDASTIDNACKSYYAAIVAGSLHSSTPDKKTNDTLPAANASATVKKSMAKNCTVKGALEWNGTYSSLGGAKLADFFFDSNGNVYAKLDSAHSSATQNTIEDDTKFSDMNYN